MAFLFTRGGGRLLKSGTPGEGRIVGIRRFDAGDTDSGPAPAYDYAVEVRADPPFTAGVRQTLGPRDTVRLGMDVAVLHDGQAVVIDWRRTCGGDNGRARIIRTVPAPGIVDEMLHLDRPRTDHLPAAAAVTGARRASRRLGFTAHTVLEVVVHVEDREPYPAQIAGWAPEYASHLPVDGAVLPAFVNPRTADEVRIDWPAAAMADPGVGRPPAPLPG